MKIYSTSFSLNMFITNIGKNMKSYFVTGQFTVVCNCNIVVFLQVLVRRKSKDKEQKFND